MKNQTEVKPTVWHRLRGARLLVAGILIGALIFGGGAALAGSAFLAEISTSRVFVDGSEIIADAFTINGSNYFKIRDIAKALDVGVWYDEGSDRIYIETDIGYDAKYTGVRSESRSPLTAFRKSASVKVDNKQQYDLGLSSTEGFTATVTIVEIVRGEEATEIVKNANPHNPSAGIGKEYILAWVRAKITDAKAKELFVLSDISANMTCFSTDDVEYPISTPTINPVNEQPREIGDTVEGWVAFAVERNDPQPKVRIGTNPDSPDSTCWFALFE